MVDDKDTPPKPPTEPSDKTTPVFRLHVNPSTKEGSSQNTGQEGPSDLSDQERTVLVLTELLAQAKQGQFNQIAVIACDKAGNFHFRYVSLANPIGFIGATHLLQNVIMNTVVKLPE